MDNKLLPTPWKILRIKGRCAEAEQLSRKLPAKEKESAFIEKALENGGAFTFGNPRDADAAKKSARKALEKLSREITDRDIMQQAYAICLRSRAAAVAASGRQGMYYALDTLRKILAQKPLPPCCDILDKPMLKYRGFMQDISRGQVLSIKGFERLVDALARFRYNMLTFNIEHTFKCKKHPEIGKGHTPLTKQDLAHIVKYAKNRGIEVVPAQQSMGHLRGILSLPEFKDLAYDKELLWSIDPSNEKTYSLLQDLYEEILPCCDSRFFNVCCDEPFDIKAKFDPARFKGKTFEQVFFDHIMRLKEILDRHGKQMMLWADVPIEHTEIIKMLPRDVILLNWQYGSGMLEGPEYYREKINPVAQAGLDFMTCTCTWNLTKIFTNLDVAEANNLNFITEAAKAGAVGNILTNWGDMGHLNLLALQPWPIAYAAQIAWNGKPLAKKTFDKAFAKSFFNDDSGQSAEIMRILQRANNIIKGPQMFGDVAFQVFFDETLAGDFMLNFYGKTDTHKKIEKLMQHAESLLEETLNFNIENKEWLKDIELPIIQFKIIAEKIKIFTQAKKKAQTAKGLLNLAEDFDNLAKMTDKTAYIMKKQWVKQAKKSDLDQNINRLNNLKIVYKKRSKMFHQLAEEKSNNKPMPAWSRIAYHQDFIKHKFNLIKEMGLDKLL